MDGALFSTLAWRRRWIEQGLPGSVVSMLVTWVWTGSAYVLPSVMSKTALHAMTMSLAVEWGRHGIRVNAVAPGPFPTESGMGKARAIRRPMSAQRRRLKAHGAIRPAFRSVQPDAVSPERRLAITHRPEHRIDGAHHLAATSTFAELSQLSSADWAEARDLVRRKAVQERAQRAPKG